MKSFLKGATALAGIAFAGSAFAADLPRRAAPPIFTPVPVFTWTGFYAGFNAGYGTAVDDYDGSRTIIRVPGSSGLLVNNQTGLPAGGRVRFFNSTNDGFVGGGQIGYNYQFTPGSGVVVGVEADAQYADFGRNRNRFDTTLAVSPAPGTVFFNPTGVSSLDFFGTVRGRLGYAFDRVLFYGTGGFAYGSSGGNDFGGARVDVEDFQTGWTAGGGVEYALPTDSFLNFFRSSAVTVKAEALYVNLDQNNGRAFAVNGNGTVFTVGSNGTFLESGPLSRDTEFAVVRGGLNYKFGSY